MSKLKFNTILFFTLASICVVRGQEKIENQTASLKQSNTKIAFKNNKGEDRIHDSKITDSSKTTINTTAKQIHHIKFDGINYYIIDGIWYTKFKNKLTLRRAPKGANIPFLPKNSKIEIMGGIKYYKANGVFYKRINNNLYEVARP